MRLQEDVRQHGASRLALDDHIIAALGAHEAGDEGGLWQSKLWTFIRVVKAHPELRNVKPKQAVKLIERSIAQWCEGRTIADRAAHSWETYFGLDREDAQAEIADAWPKVRCVYGSGPVDNAIEQADAQPISFGDCEQLSIDAPGYQRFLSMAGWLQVAVGKSAIMLPLDHFAPLLGVERKTIARWRRFAIGDGFLRVLQEHVPGKAATKFLFDVRRVPMLREAAPADTIAVLKETDA